MSFGNPRIPTEISALRKLNAKAKANTINLGLGQPEIDMPDSLRKLAVSAIKNHKLGYTPNAGRSDLRLALSEYYGISTPGTILTHGAQEGLFAVLMALLNQGDEVLVPDPGFLAYPTMITMAGGKAVSYSLKSSSGNFEYSVDAILAKVGPKTKAVLLCSPNNPTGTVISSTERDRLLFALAKKKVFLLSDDVYAELCWQEKYVPVSSLSKFGVTINSWSKSLALTGWRLGFVHTDHKVFASKILAAHQYLITCASSPAQALLLEIFQHKNLYNQTVGNFQSAYRSKLNRLLGFFPAKNRPQAAGGGFYVFLPLPSQSDQKTAEQLLEKQNLLVVPGSYFGKAGKGCVRISVAASDDAIDRAGTILSKLFI